MSRGTPSIFSLLKNEQANFLAAESTLEASRATRVLTPVLSHAAALRLGTVGETRKDWHQSGITAGVLYGWGGGNKKLPPSRSPLVLFPSHCTNYGSHFSISLNPVGLPYVKSARSLTTPSTAPTSLFPCGYQPPHPSVPFWLYIFGALVQVRLDATSSNYANALVVRWCLLRCFWFVRGDPLRQGCPLQLSRPC